MAENDVETESSAPDLHVRGKARRALVKMADGRRSMYPLPQTKWDNCMSVMREVDGRPVSEADLGRWQLTAREYEHFLAVYGQSSHANGRAVSAGGRS